MAPVLLFSAPISKNPESLALNSCAVEVPAAKTSRTARKPLLMSRDRSIVVLPFCDCSYPNRGRLLFMAATRAALFQALNQGDRSEATLSKSRFCEPPSAAQLRDTHGSPVTNQ